MITIVIYPDNSVTKDGTHISEPEKILREFKIPLDREEDETIYRNKHKIVMFYNVKKSWKRGNKENNKPHAKQAKKRKIKKK